jgi:hypothetical protein
VENLNRLGARVDRVAAEPDRADGP